MRSTQFKLLVINIALALLLLPVTPVLANSGPPPTQIWFTFDYQTTEPTTLEGFQLIACDSIECEHPTLLQQYGKCYSEECLASSTELTVAQEPECLGDTCLLNFYPERDISTVIIVAQFADGTRQTKAITQTIHTGGTTSWKITVLDAELLLSKGENFRKLYANYDNFLEHFGFTLIIELLVAIVTFFFWLKIKNQDLLRGMFYVLLANIISYPVTWFLWPSLRRFQPGGDRSFGFGVAIITIVYTAFFVVVAQMEGKKRKRMFIISFVVLPVALFAAFVCAFASFYGSSPIALQGLPFGLTVLLAEIFAILFETALVYLLAKKTLSLSWKHVAYFCLVANVMSYVLGKWVLTNRL